MWTKYISDIQMLKEDIAAPFQHSANLVFEFGKFPSGLNKVPLRYHKYWKDSYTIGFLKINDLITNCGHSSVN